MSWAAALQCPPWVQGPGRRHRQERVHGQHQGMPLQQVRGRHQTKLQLQRMLTQPLAHYALLAAKSASELACCDNTHFTSGQSCPCEHACYAPELTVPLLSRQTGRQAVPTPTPIRRRRQLSGTRCCHPLRVAWDRRWRNQAPRRPHQTRHRQRGGLEDGGAAGGHKQHGLHTRMAQCRGAAPGREWPSRRGAGATAAGGCRRHARRERGRACCHGPHAGTCCWGGDCQVHGGAGSPRGVVWW